MIYVCIPARDEAESIGLILWKTRKVFEGLGREYQVIVSNDGSSDHSAEVLELYESSLPLIVLRHPAPVGYRTSVEELLRRALEFSDRPRRDVAILMHADFGHGPEYISDFLRRMDSGADIVVGQAAAPADLPRTQRWARRWGAFLMRRTVQVAQVSDPMSGFVCFRLATLKSVFEGPSPVLTTEDSVANAELLGLAAKHARSVQTIDFHERPEMRSRPSRRRPWSLIRGAWRSSRAVRRTLVTHQVAPRTSKRRGKEKEGVG